MEKQAKIIIVAPDKYFVLARASAQLIYNKIKLEASPWKVEQLKNNEVKIPTSQMILAIGGKKENEFLKSYLQTIKNTQECKNTGAFYGYNKSKAVIYGDGDSSKFDNVVTELNNIIEENKKKQDKISLSLSELPQTKKQFHIRKDWIDIVSILLLQAVGVALPLIRHKKDIIKTINDYKMLNLFKNYIALDYFFKNFLDEWVKVNEKT